MLNYGDCLAYGVAMAAGEPLLFKGDDFRQTDVVAASTDGLLHGVETFAFCNDCCGWRPPHASALVRRASPPYRRPLPHATRITPPIMRPASVRLLAPALLLLPASLAAQGTTATPASAARPAAVATGPALGYYRFPAIHGDTIVFAAEGDLWRVPLAGGVAPRLTTHAGRGVASRPSRPTGATIAFSAAYEGPTEVYTMPLAGGPPARRTFDGGERHRRRLDARTAKILYSTRTFSTLPNTAARAGSTRAPDARDAGPARPGERRLATTATARRCSSPASPSRGATPSATRAAPRRTSGVRDGRDEAVPLTADYTGTSKAPMFWQGRVYFVERPRRHDEPLVDGHGGARPQAAHPPRRLGRPASPRSPTAGSSTSSAPTSTLFDIASRAGRGRCRSRLVSDFDQMRENVGEEADRTTSPRRTLSPDGRPRGARPRAARSSWRPRSRGASSR